MSELYPINLSLAGRPVLLVGGGAVALQKAGALAGAGAVLRVVAPAVALELVELAASVATRPFDAARDLDGMQLVVAAASPEVNREVTRAARARGLFVLAVDQPADGSAQSPAVLRRGGLTLAISTSGAAPALAGLLREALEAILPDELEAASWIELAKQAREGWKREGTPHGQRRSLLLAALAKLHAEAEAVTDSVTVTVSRQPSPSAVAVSRQPSPSPSAATDSVAATVAAPATAALR